MRLLTYTTRGRTAVGALRDDGIVDLTGGLGVDSVTDLLAAERLDEARRYLAAGPVAAELDTVTLRRPIEPPRTIVCVGINYRHRDDEYASAQPAAAYPSIFMRTAGSLVAHGEPLMRPPESLELDYEGEIAIVIGRPGRRIPAARADTHIAGLTCLNEGTIRDWVRHGRFNVTPGKNFERSGAIGPWIATLDEAPPLDRLSVTTRVNGETRQHDTTDHLLFSIPRLVEYVSTFMALFPGDVIATGTPTGAGARFDPPRFLRPGDRVEVTVSGVGTLSNDVADEIP
ncbi:MAG: fumarylacetoacetate hydrolase family protein [Vicinamibacterales bacterium]